MNEQVLRLVAKHETETGKKPNVLYLGVREWEQLSGLIRESTTIKQIKFSKFEGCEYFGMRVLQVVYYSYMAVGME